MTGVKFGFLMLGPVPDIRREEQTSTKEIKIRRGGGHNRESVEESEGGILSSEEEGNEKKMAA